MTAPVLVVPEVIDLTHLEDEVILVDLTMEPDEEEQAERESVHLTPEYQFMDEEEEQWDIVSEGSFEVPDDFVVYREPTFHDMIMDLLDEEIFTESGESESGESDMEYDESESEEEQVDLEDAVYSDDERMAQILFNPPNFRVVMTDEEMDTDSDEENFSEQEDLESDAGTEPSVSVTLGSQDTDTSQDTTDALDDMPWAEV